MSDHSTDTSTGFTLVEIVITIALIGIFSVIFLVMFKTTLFSYLDLQKQATSFSQLSAQADRIGNVIRGATSVQSAGDNDLTVYAYFYPSDAYVSQVRYYVITSNGQKQLKADLTPMTANPPLGTLNVSRKRTLTLIDNLYQPASGKLFSYTNATNTVLATPVSDLATVKTVNINLSTNIDNTVAQSMQLQVFLRNKKNNL